MATLTTGISASQTVIPVTGTAPEPGSYLTVGSENIRFLGTSRGPQGRSFLRTYWSVDRGVAGTTKATHSGGASLTQYYPDAAGSGGGGGSISATDGVTTVDPATSLSFPSGTVSDSGGGLATVGALMSIRTASVAFNTPDFVNPPNSVGVALFDLPAGSRALIIGYITTAFDQGAGELTLSVGADAGSAANNQMPSLAVDSPVGGDGNVRLQARPYTTSIDGQIQNGAQALASNDVQDIRDRLGVVGDAAYDNAVLGRVRWVHAVIDCTVFAGYYPIGSDPTTGAATFDAIIATPA